jgi:ADP-ribose pyrophosphatase YjhB (NUDIX family)
MPAEPWLAWARELQAIAQAGLYYTKDVFDRERFERVRELACECMGELSAEPIERVRGLFANEDGYQTPKMDTRAAIPDDEGRLCLVHERGGAWSLPGGWVDQGQTVFSNTVKEAREEAGLVVEPVRLVAIQEHNLHNPHPCAWGIMKHFVLCRNLGGEFVPNDETVERGFFSADELPDLFESKNTADQLALCFDCLEATRAGRAWDPSVD